MVDTTDTIAFSVGSKCADGSSVCSNLRGAFGTTDETAYWTAYWTAYRECSDGKRSDGGPDGWSRSTNFSSYAEADPFTGSARECACAVARGSSRQSTRECSDGKCSDG